MSEAATPGASRMGRERGRRLWPWLVGLVALAAVVSAAIAFVVVVVVDDDDAPAEPTEPGERIVAEFSGEGDETTDDFEVGAEWYVEWETTGGETFRVELLTGDEQSRGVIIDFEGEAGGTTFPPAQERGTFVLRVTTEGTWSIQIVEMSE